MGQRFEEVSDEFLREKFPDLWQLIEPLEVTDVDFNCGNIWISFTDKKEQRVDSDVINEDYMRNVANSIAVYSGCEFNPKVNRMFVATKTLRVSCVHPSVSNGCVSVCLRKELADLRFTKQEAVESGWCDLETYNMLQNCVLAHENMTWCGVPQTGKTEGVKRFSSYIPLHEKVITIEDVGELHFADINPGHNCIELKTQKEGYKQCINDALRMNPMWIVFSEAIGENTQQLLECWSNGVATMSTQHVDDTRDIPDKMINSADLKSDTQRVINQVYKNLGVAVLMKKLELDDSKIKRYVDQVTFYYKKSNENGYAMVVKDGKLYKDRIPDFIRERIEKKVGRDIFSYPKEIEVAP